MHVFIAAGARGLGVGEGTLKPVNILGRTHSVWEDGSDDVGTTNPNGSWTYSTAAFVATFITTEIPEDSEQTSFPWSAEGTVKLTPYVWQQSVSAGGTVSLPIAISGSYSTSGTWALSSDLSTTQSAASGTSGTHTVDVKYYCSSCNVEGDTKASIGNKAAHAETTCTREGCGVKYRACDTAAKALHSLCEGCNEYRCNGESHIQKNCSSAYFGSTLIYGCGQPYWTCASDASNHTSWSYCSRPGITHGYRSCVASMHTIQASCTETDENGNPCDVTGFYPCEYHRHQGSTNTGSTESGSTESGSTESGSTESGSTTPTPTPDPEPEPEPEEDSGTTCANGHPYDPDNTSEYNRHRTRTCRYEECGNTWEKCVSRTPKCNKPWRKARGKYCWAIE